MEQIFTGKLFQSEGALNIKAFLAVAFVNVGTIKRKRKKELAGMPQLVIGRVWT